jgi:alpha-mannosidase
MEFNLIYKSMRLEEIKKAKHLLEQIIYAKIADASLRFARTKEPVAFQDKDKMNYVPIQVGESWGDLFDCAWFECSGKIDKKFLEDDIFIRLDISGEALLYDDQGVPVKGFTNGSSVFDRQYGEPGKLNYRINDLVREDGSFCLFFDCGCNDLFGNYQDNGKVILAEISLRDSFVEEIYYDVETLIDLLLVFKEDSEEYNKLFSVLHEIYQLVEYDEADMLLKIKHMTKDYFSKNKYSESTVYALGHAHLDLAWLWPIRETKRKLLRTLTNVFYLFEKYEDFTFGFSQPQLLEWLETESPELYKKVQHYVKEGRFELQGGAWVEMDTNLTGEEAMVRHFLYGMNYYRSNFDFEPKSLWLPDVFGYSGNLPQIIKKCGMDYFMTIKISWSLINQFPHHTFIYEGIDGSQVLAHMPPEGNYNSSAYAHAVKLTQDTYREKELSEETMLLFGIGDGGGGPGDEHMERIHRNQRLQVLPNVEILSSDKFFEKLAEKAETYPTYHGELYLENHQGTFTSQSNIKKLNRQIEQKLNTVEYLLAYQDNQEYKDTIDKIWKEVLLYQFHDILPGSSIRRVYDETISRYLELNKDLDNLLDLLSDNNYVNNLVEADYIFNPLPFTTTLYLNNDNIVRKVKVEGLSSNKILDHEEELIQIPYTKTLVTSLFSLTLDSLGEITSYIDRKTNKELINSRNSNALRVYKDVGDAWNINYGYRSQTPKKLMLESVTLHEGNDFYEYHMSYRFRCSSIRQKMRVFKNIPYIEFKHKVDWQDLGFMLRSHFDLNIQADNVVSDIQFGSISRSRLSRNDIESAMLEVPSQQWISIDDGSFGAALINNAKYGYYIKDNLLDINLLRSTNYPCVNGDIGETSYTYGLLLHDADLNEVDMFAKKLNASYLGFSKNLVKNQVFYWDNKNIHLSVYKPAFNKAGNIIRLYNNSDSLQKTSLEFLRNNYLVTETNMIEDYLNDIGESEVLNLTFEPFEVRTFRVVKQKNRGYYPYNIPRAKKIYAYTKPMSHSETILLSSIQGVLAKKESRLYLSGSLAYKDWLDTIIRAKHEVVEIESIEEVLIEFRKDIIGYVIYSEKTDSQNVAATIAGVEGYILLEEKQLRYLKKSNLPFIDARELDYKFMLEHYQEDLNFEVIIQQAPIYCGLYDLGIALRGVYTSNIKTELIDLGVKLKKDTPVLGWVPDDEVIGVTYLSSVDCNMIASNHSLNTTVFLQRNSVVFPANNVTNQKENEKKHYITFVLSDGDNVQWMMGDYYQNHRTYGHPLRGRIPFGWSISPSMVDLAPEIMLEYYKNKKSLDYMTSGVSGAGYMYPDQYSQEALEMFLDRTEYYFKKLGIEYLAILGTRDFDDDKSCLEAYARREQIKGAFLYANFDRYKGYDGKIWWYKDKPFVSARYALWDYDDLNLLASKINNSKVIPNEVDGYSMIVVHTWSHTYQDVLDLISQLDEHIEVINPKQFMEQVKANIKR